MALRSKRDVPFLVIAAVAIIVRSSSEQARRDHFALTGIRALIVGGSVAVVLLAVGFARGLSQHVLELAVSEKYPTEASAVVERERYKGPLYNDFNWGGYLIWRLPNLPVVMDGRTNLNGDKRMERSFATWSGKRDWASDPELVSARLVIADANGALASLMRLSPRYKLVHEDKVAVVFVVS
jgi:hypothetical protein